MNNRMLVAILIEYRRATVALKNSLLNLSEKEFAKIRDENTKDEACKSILSVVSHCTQSGYIYANYINSITQDSTWFE